VIGEISSEGRMQMNQTSFAGRGVRQVLFDREHQVYVSLTYNFTDLTQRFNSFVSISENLNSEVVSKYMHEFPLVDSHLACEICYIKPYYYVSTVNLE
jgi:hypothetical protein